jgi:aspartyl-tRNA(Asn)/glutamyl-tRNA(Gln) amidotransferase subunit B
LPELPGPRQERFMSHYGLPAYDAGQLTSSRRLAQYYEEVVKTGSEPKLAANWVLNELLFLLNEKHKVIDESPVTAAHLGELLALIHQGTVSGKMAKEILAEMFVAGKCAADVMSSKGLAQINEPEKIAEIARQIIAGNPKQVEQYRSGKTATLGWFVGQLMKATGGQANPKVVQEILKRELG